MKIKDKEVKKIFYITPFESNERYIKICDSCNLKKKGRTRVIFDGIWAFFICKDCLDKAKIELNFEESKNENKNN